jgi:uncharacterized protein YndB with AHSA1/START domain
VTVAYESFSVSEIVPADPERIYAAWLSSVEHTAFTGDDALIEPFVGGKHSSFGGYAVGSTVELQPGARIVQTWRAEDFPPGTPDSRVEVTLEATVGGTMVTIFHTEIPSGQGDNYRDGWLKFYLEALKKYFAAPALATPKANGVSRPSAAKLKARGKAKRAVKPKARAAAKPARGRKTKRLVAKAKPKAKVKAKAKARPKAKAKKPVKPKKKKRRAQKK